MGGGHGHGDQSNQKRAGEDRDGAERPTARDLVLADGDLRLPIQPEEELERRDPIEEAQRFNQKRQNNAKRGQNGNQGAGDHQTAQDALRAVARPELRANAAGGENQA